jgi:hypothetical protein
METYFVMRNGDRSCSGWPPKSTSQPRLLPLREEFHKPFEKSGTRSTMGQQAQTPRRSEKMTPDHLNYDEHVEKRAKQMAHYNRVLFLIQGLLDRSEVFQAPSSDQSNGPG